MSTTTDRWWKYKGFIIWHFDGYFDVQEGVDDDPLDTFSTAEDARAFINQYRKQRQLEKLLTGSVKNKQQRRKA